jgi:hypothetical protein
MPSIGMSLNDLQPFARIQQINRTAFVVALAQQEIVFVATRDGPIAIQTDGILCTSREEVHKYAHRQPRA